MTREPGCLYDYYARPENLGCCWNYLPLFLLFLAMLSRRTFSSKYSCQFFTTFFIHAFFYLFRSFHQSTISWGRLIGCFPWDFRSKVTFSESFSSLLSIRPSHWILYFFLMKLRTVVKPIIFCNSLLYLYCIFYAKFTHLCRTLVRGRLVMCISNDLSLLSVQIS